MSSVEITDPREVPARVAPPTVDPATVPHVTTQEPYHKPDGYFSMGPNTLKIDLSIHKANRQGVCEMLTVDSDQPPIKAVDDSTFIILKGGTEIRKYDTDTNWNFRQESNIQYLFGVKEPGVYAAIHPKTCKSFLFVPDFPDSYAVWMGPIKPQTWFLETYKGVDEVHYIDDMAKVLNAEGAKTLMWYDGTNRDSSSAQPQPHFPGDDNADFNFEWVEKGDERLWMVMGERRSIKSAAELEILTFACEVTSYAHIETMVKTQAGMMEYVSEANFRYQSMLRGCAATGYDCICGSGVRNTWLHYGHAGEPNAEMVPKDAMRLIDMGAEYHCYTGDITCSYPENGKFTDDQATVYNAVLDAVFEVEKSVKPDVSYIDMHRLAERVMLEAMTKAGLFKGDIDEMVSDNVCSYFMPHGLGHMLGLDVHDVGGYEWNKSKRMEPGLDKLRCGRTLKKGHVITVEPGFYFNTFTIEDMKSSLPDGSNKYDKYVNDAVYKRMFHVGGIRIEDNIEITDTGCRVLNKVPRTVQEIEHVMAGGDWKLTDWVREYDNSDSGYPTK